MSASEEGKAQVLLKTPRTQASTAFLQPGPPGCRMPLAPSPQPIEDVRCGSPPWNGKSSGWPPSI